MRKLVFLGATANNADIVDAVQRINDLKPTFDVLGYVSPNGEPQPGTDLGFLGGDDTIGALPSDVQVIGFRFGPGNYRAWPQMVADFGLPDERWATVIDPRASVSRRSTVGFGSVVLAGTMVGTDVRIGNHTVILQNATLSHDDVIDDYCAVSVGATFAGFVHVERNCFIGAGSTLIARTVGEGSMVGAGSLIRRDVPAGEVWVGNPGRLLRKVT